MKDEMDAMKMDERQRLCWYKANRALIFFIFLVWLFMIASEFNNGRIPYFLLIMIPVFALARLVFYKLYSRKG
ncbi:MAG: hypothetical protein AB1746_11570 [Candidatus Zixiibacteriota bacterium]